MGQVPSPGAYMSPQQSQVPLLRPLLIGENGDSGSKTNLTRSEGRCATTLLAVGRRGLEPRTYGLKVRSSTIELATRVHPKLDIRIVECQVFGLHTIPVNGCRYRRTLPKNDVTGAPTG
jgi:hypothetical protein